MHNIGKKAIREAINMIIEVWYDHNSNSWVTMLLDNEGNQEGNAFYVHSKKEAIDHANIFKKDHTGSTIKVFKRNGELQKEIS